ncbi:DUF1622 domain-containing protein [Patescibacteria group bacterium]
MITELIQQVAELLATTTGIIGIVIIVIGVLVAAVEYSRSIFKNHPPGEDIAKSHIDPVRVELGRYINFGLEFMIAKDVIETIFAPSWTEIGQFAALVAIRTVISFFLIYEIDKIESRKKGVKRTKK